MLEKKGGGRKCKEWGVKLEMRGLKIGNCGLVGTSFLTRSMVLLKAVVKQKCLSFGLFSLIPNCLSALRLINFAVILIFTDSFLVISRLGLGEQGFPQCR